MSLSIPHSFVGGPGNKARASEVNANFAAISAKFTEGPGGISDSDVSATAGIKGGKLSGVPGNRLTQAQLEDDAVESRTLRDDPTAGSPSAAVGSADHIKDGIITNAKMLNSTLKSGKLALASVVITIPPRSPDNKFSVGTGLISLNAFPLVCIAENEAEEIVHMRLRLDTSTGVYYVVGANANPTVNSLSFNVRVWYLQVT